MAVLTKITSRSLGDNAVTSAKIADGAIAVADVADGSISTAKLADDAVTQAKIGAGAVGNTEVNASAAIDSAKLATIPNSKLADDPLSGTNAATVAGTYTAEQQKIHGSTFTTTGSTITGDVVFESLTDKEVTFSGTGTITGSGGKMTMKGLESAVAENDTINTPYINAGGISTGDLNWNTVTKGTLNDNITYPDGHIVQVKRKLLTAAYNEGSMRGPNKRKIMGIGALYVDIVPKYDNSSILIISRWAGSVANYWDMVFGIMKNGIPLNDSTAGGQEGLASPPSPFGSSTDLNNIQTVDMNTIDNEGTVAGMSNRYSVYCMYESATQSDIYTNARLTGNTDETGSSEITAMEIIGIVGT